MTMAKWDLSKLEKGQDRPNQNKHLGLKDKVLRPCKMNTTFIVAASLAPVLMFLAGLMIGYQSHPYESCSREHVGGDSIGECVWLKLQKREP